MNTTLLAAALAVAALAAPQTMTARKYASQKKEFAIQLYSIHGAWGNVNENGTLSPKYTQMLDMLAKVGFTGVETANYDHDRGTFYGRTPAQFKADVENAGLEVLSSHTAHGIDKDELEAGRFDRALAWWDKTIADHKAAGMKYIVSPWFEIPKTLAQLDTYCRYFDAVGRKCKAAGIAFGYHNHSHEFKTKVDDKVVYDYMLEHTDPALVFFQMDLYWAVQGGVSPVSYFKCYPGRFKMFHVKDHKELGESGMVGFDAIFRYAGEAGLRDMVGEFEAYDLPLEQSLNVSIDYVHGLDLIKSSYRKGR